jgi:hypothetical protein
VAGLVGAAGAAFPPKILNITVPQVGHLPLIALRPFFITSSTPSAISRLALHLTQYPSAISKLPCVLHAVNGLKSLSETAQQRNFEKNVIKLVNQPLIAGF